MSRDQRFSPSERRPSPIAGGGLTLKPGASGPPEFPGDSGRARYPWEQSLDGSVWLLRQGDDYETSTISMRATATKAAKKAGKRLRTRIVRDDQGEGLAIQAY